MRFVRPIDFDRAQLELEGGYRGQILYSGESCHIIATLVPPGAAGPPLHRHTSDQIYLVLEGEITIELGGEVRTAGPDTAIFIPAGVPHRNWNAGDVPEVHLEVIAPGVLPIAPLLVPADDTDANGLPHYVRAAADDAGGSLRGMGAVRLVDRAQGSEHAALVLLSVEPGGSGPPMHVHDFDQFFLVREGTLSVEVALERHDVPANSLVVLPAGVPHRQWNEGDVRERHASIFVPEPLPGQPLDVGVTFSRAG